MGNYWLDKNNLAEFVDYCNAVHKKTIENDNYIIIKQPKLQILDTVMLRSGGPDMTIMGFCGEMASCCWFNGKNFQLAEFPIAGLELTHE